MIFPHARLTPLILTLACGLSCPSPGEEAPVAEASNPETPKIQDLGEGKFQIGTITFNQETRTIRFPATVNMNEGKLEFVLVHEQGKIHESLLYTKADAFNLNVALKLLRYEESPELFQIVDEDYRPTGKFHQVPEATKKAARADITLAWKNGEGVTEETPLHEWILHTTSKGPMPAGPWVYGGSTIFNGVFQAKAQGELIAIFTSNLSLFNYPGKERELDDVWEPLTAAVPEPGTPVTVILRPHSNKTP